MCDEINPFALSSHEQIPILNCVPCLSSGESSTESASDGDGGGLTAEFSLFGLTLPLWQFIAIFIAAGLLIVSLGVYLGGRQRSNKTRARTNEQWA